MNVPNVISLLRIALVPGYLIGVIHGYYRLALVIFVVAALTDVLDGFLARRLHQESVLGLYLDPTADKLLIIVSYVSLAVLGLLPAWVAIVVFFKDLFIALGVAIIFFSGRKPVVKPSLWGKQTTFLQILAVVATLACESADFDWSYLGALFWLTGGMTIFSGCQYIMQGLRQMDEGDQSVPPGKYS
jgi:cardiolipin synthase